MKEFFSTEGPFATGANLIGDWIVISVLWVLCSLPLFTAGAAATAAYYATVKSIREHRGHVVTEFFHSFKENFKQSVVFSILYLIMAVVFVMDWSFLNMNQQVFTSPVYLLILLFAAMFVIANAAFLYPCLSRYILKIPAFIKLALLLQCKHMLVTLLALVLFSIGVAAVFLQPWSILILPGLNLYIYSFAMERLLKKYAPKQ